jgi:hypothetical protein
MSDQETTRGVGRPRKPMGADIDDLIAAIQDLLAKLDSGGRPTWSDWAKIAILVWKLLRANRNPQPVMAANCPDDLRGQLDIDESGVDSERLAKLGELTSSLASRMNVPVIGAVPRIKILEWVLPLLLRLIPIFF